MRSPKSLNSCSLGFLLVLSVCSLGCRPEPFPLPDPNEELLPVSCEEDLVISLRSTVPTSDLTSPPWQQICTVCPSDSIDLRIVDENSTTAALVTAWADQGSCAVAMPVEPLSPENNWTLEASLTDGDRSGTFRAEVEPSEGSGPPPLDLGSGTWLASAGVANMPIPINSAEIDPSLPQLELPEFLIGLSDAGKNGDRSLSIATVTDGAQDPCFLTTELDDASLSDDGQLSAVFNEGSVLPTALGSVLKRGAIRAQLADDSASLSEVVIMAVLQVEAMATESGGTVEETCAQWQEQLGSNPCVPCGDPVDSIDGPSHCITTVLEWSDVTQAQVPLQPISIDSISPDCPTP